MLSRGDPCLLWKTDFADARTRNPSLSVSRRISSGILEVATLPSLTPQIHEGSKLNHERTARPNVQARSRRVLKICNVPDDLTALLVDALKEDVPKLGARTSTVPRGDPCADDGVTDDATSGAAV